MINSRSLIDLDPTARTVCLAHLALCHLHGIELIVTSTWRDFESQDSLYAIGRTVELNRHPVTNAKAGHSWHNFKLAWDVVPVIKGKPVWNAEDPVWLEVIQYGKEVGAEAGADWKILKNGILVPWPDKPHFQKKPDGLELAEALVRFQSAGTVFTA